LNVFPIRSNVKLCSPLVAVLDREQNNILMEQYDMLWEQNNILREQYDMLWEQNNILREQDNILWEQNSMLWEQNIFLVGTK